MQQNITQLRNELRRILPLVECFPSDESDAIRLPDMGTYSTKKEVNAIIVRYNPDRESIHYVDASNMQGEEHHLCINDLEEKYLKRIKALYKKCTVCESETYEDGLSLADLKKLQQDEILVSEDPDYTLPDAKVFMDFMKTVPGCTANVLTTDQGYKFIYGLELKNPKKNELVLFSNKFRDADRFYVSKQKCKCEYL